MIENLDFKNSVSLKNYREGFQKFVDFGSVSLRLSGMNCENISAYTEVFKVIYYLLKYTNCEVKVSRANKPINCSSAVRCLIFFDNGLWFLPHYTTVLWREIQAQLSLNHIKLLKIAFQTTLDVINSSKIKLLSQPSLLSTTSWSFNANYFHLYQIRDEGISLIYFFGRLFHELRAFNELCWYGAAFINDVKGSKDLGSLIKHSIFLANFERF